MNRSPHQILKEYWGYETFRPMQEEIILSVLNKNDTLAILPTGGGKSICYQVPALAREGLCLVVSPLIALMKDQVENLLRRGITAMSIHSGMKRNEVINTLRVAGNSNCKFLYVSPERLETNLFKEYLLSLNINLIAIDEAHCISQWGYDFRPSYLKIVSLREELPNIPILAVTASATPDVQKDICQKLNFAKPTIFHPSFERPNLSYSIFNVDSKINKLIEILKNVKGSAIVYCSSRKRTHEIASLLALQNISSDYYHAGLTTDERSSKQEAWIKNKTRVIVCTNAFGMGIDKPDVRVVVHIDTPDCLENYYQEAGRAGRDGKKSYAVLLFNEKDIEELFKLEETRFPTVEQIQKVYESVCNYLHIPVHGGDEESFDFDLTDCIKKYKLESRTTFYALKSLEQENRIALNGQVFIPASVQFTADRLNLAEFEKTFPNLSTTIKTLLRTYEGIFDYPAKVSVLQMVKLMKESAEEINKNLTFLHQQKIIQYQPQKDSPQIYFLNARVKTEDLNINEAALNTRKNIFRKRVDNFIQFIKNKTTCRSQYIGHYFGDNEIRICGICDNCLRFRKMELSKEDFESMQKHILEKIKNKSLHSNELLTEFAGTKKEKAWKVVEFLQAENKIETDKNGLLKLK